MRTKLFLLFLILLLQNSQVFAEESKPVVIDDAKFLKVEITNGFTLDDAIDFAIRNNLEIKSKESDIKFYEGGVKAAGARQNPFLEGFASRAENTYYGGLTYLIETNGKRKKRIDLAKTQLEAQKKGFEIKLWDIRCSVRQLYTKLDIDLDWLKIKEDRTKLNENLVEITKKRYNSGDVPVVDIKLAEQILLNSQSDLTSFKNEVLNDRISLNLKLCLKPIQQWSLETRLDELSKTPDLISLDELINKTLEANYAIKEADLAIKSAEAELKIAKANRIPNVSQNLGVAVSNALNTSNSSPDNFSTNIRVDTQVELPTFNRQQGPIKESLAKIEKYKHEKSLLIQQIAGEVSSFYEKLKSIEDKLDLAKKSVESSKEIAALTQEGYLYGEMSLLQVLNAKQSLRLAEDTYYTTLVDLQQTITDLERAAGIPLNEATI